MQNENTRTPAWRERLAVPAAFTTMFLMGVAVSLLGPSLPGISQRTGSSLAETAGLFTLFAGGSLAATLGLARLVDRPTRHALMVAGSALFGAALWAAARSSTLAWTGAWVALAGFGMSCTGILPNVLMVEIYGKRAPARLNALHMCSSVGSFLGPLAVGLALQRGGDYSTVFGLLASLELLAALLWLAARPPRPPHTGRELPAFSPALIRPVLALVFLALLYVGAEQTIGGWLFSYARQVIVLDAAAAGAATSTFWLATIAGRLAATQALRRFNSIALLVICVLAGGAGVGLMLLAGWLPAGLWAGAALAGLAFGPIFPTTMAAGTQATPERMGITSSLLIAAGAVGTMTLPWASGALIPVAGLTGSIAAVEAPLALMLLCLSIFARGRAPR